MTSVEITEKLIVLELDCERWLKWDEHPAFVDGFQALQNTTAVDVVASVTGEGPVFIELKDFRAAAIANKKKFTSGSLAREIAANVRDTLAGLVWACGRGISETFHEGLTREFLERRKAHVILWLETDGFEIAGTLALQDAIRTALKPHIEAKVTVTSTLIEKRSASPLTWLRASGLPSTRLATRERRSTPRRRS